MAELFAMKTPLGQLDPKKLKYPVMVQPKLDGLRGLFFIDKLGWAFKSFSGKPLWNLEYVADHMPTAPGVYDGEIIWPGHEFSDAYGLCKRHKPDPKKYPNHEKDKTELQFHVFDLLAPVEWAEKVCKRGYFERHLNLVRVLGPEAYGAIPGTVTGMGSSECLAPENLENAYRFFLGQGYEGLMAKQPDGRYYWTRHSDWQRYKPTVTHDVRVIAVYEETSIKGVMKGTLGGCLIEVPAEDGYPKATCKVGGGFKAAERKSFYTPNQASKWMTHEGIEMHDGSPLVGQWIEVESKLRNKETGALREPHFKRLRPDK